MYCDIRDLLCKYDNIMDKLQIDDSIFYYTCVEHDKLSIFKILLSLTFPNEPILPHQNTTIDTNPFIHSKQMNNIHAKSRNQRTPQRDDLQLRCDKRT